jgi:hypothetical protein
MQVVYAVGYEREETFELLVDEHPASPQSLSSYNKVSGEIISLVHKHEDDKPLFIKDGHCFGMGIAFPSDYTDDEGNTEAWVGFHRNIEQLRRILEKLKENETL